MVHEKKVCRITVSRFFLIIFFLRMPVLIHGMEQGGFTEKQKDSEIFTPYSDWQDKIEPDDQKYLENMQEQLMLLNQSKKTELSEEKKEEYKLPEWMVASCFKNTMPPLLKGIYNYLKSKNVDDPKMKVPAFHRILLLGKPGSSKSTTAEAIAQSLEEYGYQKEIVKGTSLIGKFRGHTANNIQSLFTKLSKKKSKIILIINELHKLVEGHKNEHTDDSETAATLWENLDEFERKKSNAVIIATANQAKYLPPELKSRFRGQYIYMPLLDINQARQVFQDILAHDKSLQLDSSIKDAFKEFDAGLKEYSFRDISIFLNIAKMFAYADKDETVGPVTLTGDHFQKALSHFKDPETAIDFDFDQESEQERQERQHKENLEMQNFHFIQQQMMHIAVTEQSVTHYNYYGDKVNFTKQTIDKEKVLDVLSDDQMKLHENKMSQTHARQKKEREEKERAEKRKAEQVEKERASKKKDSDCTIM